MKILLVDDDPFVREMLSIILESCGFDIVSAENGVDAFGKFLSNPDFRAVVTDMNMPNMGGLELAVELRNAAVDIPIVLLTAAGDEPAVVARAAECGVSECLVKDDGIQEILPETLERLLGL